MVADSQHTPPEPPTDDDLILAAMEQVQRTPSGGSGSSSGVEGELEIDAGAFAGYVVTREIHRGGQGVVYQAIHKGTKRKVAIKVLRESLFTTPRERMRFEREVEVLAQLEHPNIVAVQDSGRLPLDKGGLQFFVMDYVSGKSLDDHLKDSGRDVRGVLKLFATICEAVNAAHLRGIVHRDLKPANIRVGTDGQPHVLDFGLAKIAAIDPLDEVSPDMMTVTGQFLGTPMWASPEQVERNPRLIDPRTDVYSLGVMMYQALTGQFPYHVRGSMREVLDNILRAEPTHPSSVSRVIDDEVSTILLKCLSKERDRRYQNAGELARDLRAYLEGRAIEAKGDSAWYVLSKMLARHRAATVAGVLVLAAVCAGGIVSTVFWRRAEDRREEAQGAMMVAQRREQEATEQRLIAEREALRAGRVAGFVSGILDGADPDTLEGRDPAVVMELLLQAKLRARGDLSGEPEVLAEILDVIGRSYQTIGRYAEAEADLRSSLDIRRKLPGDHDPEISASLLHLASLRWEQGDSSGALSLLSEAEALAKINPGEKSGLMASIAHQGALNAAIMGDFGRALAGYQRSLAIRGAIFGPDSVEATEDLSSLGMLHYRQKHFDEAIEFFRKAGANLAARSLNRTIPAAVVSGNLAMALRDRVAAGKGRPEDLGEAEALARGVLAIYHDLLAEVNPDHYYYTNALNKLGQVLCTAGKLDEAEKCLRECLERRTRSNPHNEAQIALTRVSLAEVLRLRGEFDEAADLLGSARATLDRVRGRNNSATRRAYEQSVLLYEAWNKPDEAAKYR